MKIYVVPEDHRLDQHIIGPLFERLLDESDIPGNHEVRFEHDTGSFSEIQGVLEDACLKYGHSHVIVVVPDRDCVKNRKETVEKWFEDEDLQELDPQATVCVAIEEVEVWLLALYDDELEPNWTEIRGECDPKEPYFEPFLGEYGDARAVGGGRKRLMKEGLKKTSFSALLQKCEELQQLQERLEAIHAE